MDTFSDETWTSLRKGTLERLNYFGREGQVQKYKKRIRNNFLFTVPHAGPGLRATSQSYHQNPSQRNPPGTRMQAKVSLQHLSLDLVRCHSTSRAYSSKEIFPFKTGQKKPASCTLEEHLTLQAPTEHDTTFHVQSSTSSLKKKWNRCFRSVVHCGQLIV